MSDQPTLATQPETAKFLTWYEAEKKKGLLDLKFFTADITGVTSEEFFRQFNELNDAPDAPIPDYI